MIPSQNTCFLPTSASNFVTGSNSTATVGRRERPRSRAEAEQQKEIRDGTAGTCPSLPSRTRERWEAEERCSDMTGCHRNRTETLRPARTRGAPRAAGGEPPCALPRAVAAGVVPPGTDPELERQGGGGGGVPLRALSACRGGTPAGPELREGHPRAYAGNQSGRVGEHPRAHGELGGGATPVRAHTHGTPRAQPPPLPLPPARPPERQEG